MRSVDVMFVLLGGSMLIVVRTARKGRTMKAARKAPTIMMKCRAWKNSGLWGPNTAIHTEFNPEKRRFQFKPTTHSMQLCQCLILGRLFFRSCIEVRAHFFFVEIQGSIFFIISRLDFFHHFKAQFFSARCEGSIFFITFRVLHLGCPSLYAIGAQGPSAGGALPLRPGEWGPPEAKGL